jgi:hypothetical protein
MSRAEDGIALASMEAPTVADVPGSRTATGGPPFGGQLGGATSVLSVPPG